ncbi:MAG: B12-binding domain-containing radical SAM protein [Candidatus Omnitrophica bacterium]|nr:B12-binding domain-containing radical SAM protein [Candidatus Omnitrophota bacterium]
MDEVILIQSKVGDWDKVRSHPSLPLALLSSARLVAKEFKTILIDTRIERSWRRRLRRLLEKKPLCVGLTSITGRQIHYALEISKFIKQFSKVPIIWGGIHASLLPESTLENPNIDILVIGEGEETFLELVKALKEKRNLKDIAGIWYKERGVLLANKSRPFVDLNTLAPLPLDIIKINNYLPVFKGRRTFYIETARGCPNQCGFCYNSAYNKNRWRAFDARRVVEEIKYLYKTYNISSFYVIDDNTFVDTKRALAIARGIIDEKLDVYLEFQGISISSAMKFDDQDLELLVRAGMKKVHFGIESASERILKSVNKRLNIDHVLEVNKRWSRHDVRVQYNFMCGFPGETREDIRKTVELIFRLMKDNRNSLISPLCPFTPYPGTALYDQAIEDGFLHKKKLEDWSRSDYGDDIWDSVKRKKFLSRLFFASMFLDVHRSKDMVQSPILKLLIDLYRPLAKFRVKHLFFRGMLELKIKNLLFR